MSNRVKLAQLTGNDLDIGAEPTPPSPPGYKEVLGRADCALGMEEPVLSEAIRAMLIMSGCTARFVGNYWKVERRVEPDERTRGLRPGQVWRTQTGVPAQGTYEDWRRELAAFVGGLGS